MILFIHFSLVNLQFYFNFIKISNYGVKEIIVLKIFYQNLDSIILFYFYYYQNQSLIFIVNHENLLNINFHISFDFIFLHSSLIFIFFLLHQL